MLYRTLRWTFLLSFLIIIGLIGTTEARDFCHEYETRSGGVGYCMNGGICVNKEYGKECECPSGFKGDTCLDEIDECSTNEGLCMNGGTCVNIWGSYQCFCTHGFTGQNCETNIDDCVDHKCPASKICVDKTDSYDCVCPPGKFGDDCEKDDLCAITNPCAYGNCSMLYDGRYICECEKGFQGRNCDQDIYECDANPCQNGRCENTFGGYKCHCDTGFQGKNCDELVLHCAGNPCQNGGTCLNRYDGHTCVCVPGYTGPNCETRTDNSCNMDCQNGGVCFGRHSCYCPPGFEGEYCERPKPNPCKENNCGDNGYCSPTPDYLSYYCTCLPGYSGEFCEKKDCIKGECKMFVDLCKLRNVTCSNRGRCINQGDKHKCICDNKRYNGDNCEYILNGEDFNDSSTMLKGDVILMLIGAKEKAIGQLNTILHQIGQLIHVYVRIRLDEKSRPMVYEWDQDLGKGDLIDTSNVVGMDDDRFVHGKVIENTTNDVALNKKPKDGKVYRGFMLVLRIDISQCLDEKLTNFNLTCPEAAVDVAAELLKSDTNKILGPLGVSIYGAEGETEKPESIVNYIVIGGLALFGVIVLLGVLTIRKKKMSYRDRNMVSAQTWIPPKSELMNNKGYPSGSMLSLNNSSNYHQNQFDMMYFQNASTVTSLGGSSANGSLTSAPHEQKKCQELNTLPPLIQILKMAPDQTVYSEVEQQLVNGADANATEMMGRTPLMFAVGRRGEIGLQLIDLLVSYNADLKRTDRDGLTVLHTAIESIDSFNERAALHLIQHYAESLDFNAAARSEETPLKLCARIGDLTEMVVRALLKSNLVDLDSIGDETYPDSNRRTALHIATEVGSIRIMELLLRSGAKHDVKDINDQTPLHLAAVNMRKDESRLLINFGADKNLADIDGQTPEQIAVSSFWTDGPKILNEPPSLQIDTKPVDTNTKPSKRGKRAAKTETKPPKKAKNSTKANANSATEALLPAASSIMFSPPSDSSSPTNNSQGVPTQSNPYVYASYPMNGQMLDYQQPLQHAYYSQQQHTPELMNNSVCSSDSQTVSPPIFPSVTNPNTVPNNVASASGQYFDYNTGQMVGYPQQQNYQQFYDPTRIYSQMPTSQAWYQQPQDLCYRTAEKVPSHTNGVNSLEFSPNSDQSMHFGSPDTHPPVPSANSTTMPYPHPHQSYNPTSV